MLAGKVFRILDLLIVGSLIVSVVLGGLVIQTVTGAGPAISIGSVVGQFESGSMQLHIPVQISNGGYLAIQGAYVSVNIYDNAGHELINGFTGVFDVPAKSTKLVNLTLTADLRGLPQVEMVGLLTQTQTLQLNATLGASEQPLVSVHGTAAGTLPWGAIVAGMTVEKGAVSVYNSTYSRVVMNYSFSNTNQYFRLVANVSGVVKDQGGNVVGGVMPSSLVVKRGASFGGQLIALVRDSALQTATSHPLSCELTLSQTNLFETQVQVAINV